LNAADAHVAGGRADHARVVGAAGGARAPNLLVSVSAGAHADGTGAIGARAGDAEGDEAPCAVPSDSLRSPAGLRSTDTSSDASGAAREAPRSMVHRACTSNAAAVSRRR